MAQENNKSGKMNKNRLFLWALLLSFALVALLFSLPRISIYEWTLADRWAQGNYGRDVSDKVAVVGIDDDVFVVHKLSWPLEKAVYSELIFYLQSMGAKVIAIDIEFSHDQNKCDSTGLLFHSLVEASPEVVIGYGFLVQPDGMNMGNEIESPDNSNRKIRSNSILPQIDDRFAIGKGSIPIPGHTVSGALVPYETLRNSMQSCGFFNRPIPMTDGVDRWMRLMIEQDSLVFPSLALSSVHLLAEDTSVFLPEENKVVLGDLDWQVSGETDFVVNFMDSIPVYTMSELMVSSKAYFSGEEPEIGYDELGGRIIFIGEFSNSDGDLGVNPVTALNDAKKYNGKTPMVMLHAYAANTLLEDREIHYMGRTGAILLSLILLLIVYLLYRAIPQKVLYVMLPIIFLGVYFLGATLYSNYIFLPIVEALTTSILFSVAGVFINYYENNSEYRYISSVFRTYISPELIDEMVRTHTVPKLGGEEIHGTAFFTDIEKFSTFSEIFTPEELIHVLNEYFSEMTDILKENQGTLDKFIGDAIVAIFGAPYYFEDNAVYACNAAWRMQEALAKLREKWKEQPELRGRVDNMRMRIGINSGPFIVGHLGSSDRMNYTMIGDSVNLAARLESGAKQYGVYTLVGESTYNSAKKDFLFRCVDRIIVVGRSEPVSVYELLSPFTEVTEEVQKCSDTYNKALECYFAGDFSEALPLFEDAVKFELSKKKVTPSSVMAERCRYLQKNPPEQWDGVYTMQSK